MPRSRKRSSGSTGGEVETPQPTQENESTNTKTNTVTKGNTMSVLTPEQIATLLGSTRSKGQYVKYMNDFLTSGEGGVCVNEQWADLKDKKATTLKQGFENAKQNKEVHDGADNVKVLVNEDKVYLINLTAAGIAADTEDE